MEIDRFINGMWYAGAKIGMFAVGGLPAFCEGRIIDAAWPYELFGVASKSGR
jgi:hypothetical protein